MPTPATDDRWFTHLWQQALNSHAADLHLASGLAPLMRVRGELLPMLNCPPCPALPWSGLAAYFNHADAQALLQGQYRAEVDGALEHRELGRARWSLARFEHGLFCVMRLITPVIPSLNDVQLDTHLADRLLPEHGLVLITGATGSGKSSTLAALVAHRRQFLGGHTITLEDPIEFRYDEGKGRISQREIGRDSPNFASALRSALRQDPDVILLGELRDLDSARIALTAAETGHLVLSTLHTASAIGAIDRILGLFPADEQALARTQLADTLTGVISQQLIWQEQSATVIREVLLATAAVRHLIREHRLNQIEHIMQTSGSLGMQTLAQAWQRAGLNP